MSRTPSETVIVALLGALSGSLPLRLPSEEPGKRDPIAPIFRHEIEKASEASPFLEGYRWSYTSAGRFSLFLETKREAGVELTTLEAKRGTFFWTHTLLLGLKDGRLADFGGGFDRSRDQEPPSLLRFPLYIGRRWSFSEPRTGDYPSGFEAVVVGKDTVTVPAGAFEAWRIEYVLHPRLGTEYDFRAWYTSGLGFVRIEKWRESYPDGKRILEKPIVHELALVEDLETAHRVDYPSSAEPVEGLPAHVPAPPGRVTLFADFGDVWDGQVVLYLVNRTDEPIHPPPIGWEWWAKLEARSESGAWERAESHYHSFCLTGYHSVPLEPDRFMQFLGYLPASGTTRDVRYRLHGGLDVVSNTGRGLADPKDIEEARHDHIAMPQADAALLKQFFFEAAGRLEHADEVTHRAFDRLRSLPGEQAMPIVEQLLASDAWMKDAWSHRAVLTTLQAHDRERFMAYVKDVLAGPPGERRTWLLEDLDQVPFTEDVMAFLMDAARDPKTPALPRVLDRLASEEREETRALFAEIEKDPRYPEQDRVLAGYHLARAFGTFVVQMRVVLHDGSDGEPVAPGTLDVSITQFTGLLGPLRFAYSDPTNVLRLHVWADEKLLVPRPGVRWFTPPNPGGKLTEVSLEDGESHVFRLNLTDYFELPPGRFVQVAASLSIPGRHKVPQLAQCGRSIQISAKRD